MGVDPGTSSSVCRLVDWAEEDAEDCKDDFLSRADMLYVLKVISQVLRALNYTLCASDCLYLAKLSTWLDEGYSLRLRVTFSAAGFKKAWQLAACM